MEVDDKQIGMIIGVVCTKCEFVNRKLSPAAESSAKEIKT